MAANIFWRVIGTIALVLLVGWAFWKVFDRTTVDLHVHYGTPAQAAVPAAVQPAPAAPKAHVPAPTAPPVPAAQPAAGSDAAIAAALGELASASREQAQASREQAAAFNRQAEAFDRLSGQLNGRTPSAVTPDCTDCDKGVTGVQHVRPHRK